LNWTRWKFVGRGKARIVGRGRGKEEKKPLAHLSRGGGCAEMFRGKFSTNKKKRGERWVHGYDLRESIRNP